ncbi:Uroporphyrinogen-III C-methyltransferase [Coccomyxa sp. Obi]|nr:Uroporphyrinogen-III C-methyltransferase [Coccomyxa sp. Obi]
MITASNARPGRAWLVGCGPGDVELLTLKAVKLIKAAEVILYDDLGTEAAMEEFASEDAVREYVGKRGGQKSMKQGEIDELLVRYCLQGKQVVRLKGGCPSVFSRCSSEIAALGQAGIPWELVPGISSALAGPLLAGFPLTDAQLGRSFAVTSAHDPGSIDWVAFRGVDTLVLLMSGRSLPAIVDGLVSSGWSPDTPVAVVRSAGLTDQATWLSQLHSILEATKDAGSLSPCVTVVGRVVSQAPGYQK